MVNSCCPKGQRAVDWAMAPTYAYLAVVSVALIIIDIRHKILPNALTLTSYPIVLSLLTIPAVVEDDWRSWVRAFAGSLVVVVLFTALVFFSSGSFGMGDAKLGAVLALPLAWQSWTHVLVAMAGAFFLSAIVSVALLLTHRATRYSLIPFGPFLIVSTWLVTVVG